MTDDSTKGERIAKAMARAGVASRRDAEKMILEGRVAVNGQKVASPALDVLPSDKVTLDGKPIDAPQPARLWLYYKPVGLVTSAKDEKGRQTVFDTMPADMPRVMSVGRLDLTSEGLLLLTNDGGLKRQLELPSTGWLRKYRVRVNGRPNDATFDPLRRGVTIDGEEFQPMEITLDKQQGANAWLTVGLREGKNREIRRAMEEVGLIVNRLIRVSYGPFRLNTMKPGDVVEVKARVLREQLGSLAPGGGEAGTEEGRKPRGGDPRKRRDAPARGKPGGPRDAERGKDAPRGQKPFRPREAGDAPKERRDARRTGPDAGPGAARGWKDERARDGAPGRSRPGDKDRKPRHPRSAEAEVPGGRKAAGPRPDRDRSEREGDRKFSKPRGEGDPARRGGASWGKDSKAGSRTAGDAPGRDRPRGEGRPKEGGARPERDRSERGGERKFSKPRGEGDPARRGGAGSGKDAKPRPRPAGDAGGRARPRGDDRPKGGSGPRKGPTGRK